MKSARWFITSFFFLCGCSPFFTVPSPKALQNPLPPLQERWETELFSQAFSYEAMDEEGLALLAILERGAPAGVRQTAAFEIFQGFRSFFPKARIVPRSDAIERINAAGRGSDLKGFLRRYQEERSMDLDQLREWGRIEGVRYLFIGQVRFIDKHTETRTMQFSERGVGGEISVFSTGPPHMPIEVYKVVSLWGEVWDSQCGKAVWIGKSMSEVTEPVENERVRVEDIFTATSRNLIAALDKAMKENLGGGKRSDC
ncbi:MAG: hypothetical protein ACE5HN_09570 [Nitrospiria bacterium]